MSDWITPEGGFVPEAAPEGIKEFLSAKKFSDVGTFVKSYQNLESEYGRVKSGNTLPETFSEDMIPKIYRKLGTPESPDKYEYKAPEGVPIDENLLGSFKQFGHKLNLTNKQFQDVVNFQIDAMTSAQAAQAEANRKAIEEAANVLKGEWKENYETNFKKAKETAEKLELLDELEALGLADNPKVIKTLHKLNSQLSEDALKKPSAETIKTPEQQLSELMKSDAYLNRMHPEHKNAMAQFLALHGIKG